MSGWVVLGIIVLVFVLIGCIPVGVDASYHENALALRLKIGFFTVQAASASTITSASSSASTASTAPRERSRLEVFFIVCPSFTGSVPATAATSRRRTRRKGQP